MRHPNLAISQMKIFDQPLSAPQGFVTQLQNFQDIW
jgi:hypothetical protein